MQLSHVFLMLNVWAQSTRIHHLTIHSCAFLRPTKFNRMLFTTTQLVWIPRVCYIPYKHGSSKVSHGSVMQDHLVTITILQRVVHHYPNYYWHAEWYVNTHDWNYSHCPFCQTSNEYHVHTVEAEKKMPRISLEQLKLLDTKINHIYIVCPHR